MGIALFTKQKPQIGTLILDASIREDHSLETEITDNPIEDGSVVTDHVLVLPRRVSLEVVATSNPDDNLLALIGTGIQAALLAALAPFAGADNNPRNVAAGAIGGAAGAAVAGAGAAAAALGASGFARELPVLDNTRHLKAWAKLIALAKRRRPFDVVTSLEKYRNMVIERISTPRSKENTNALFITVDCREIEIARVDAAANLADQAVDAALGEQDLGAIGTEVLSA
jgi:hypothetical protein